MKNCSICGGKMKGQTYRGVKSVKRVFGEHVFDRVLVEIETYHKKTYHFAISTEQLEKLLKGGK